MRISQYAYFAVRSDSMPATELARRLGMAPDEVTVRGSQLSQHAWKIVCRDSGLTVDEQIARIVERIEPRTQLIGGLVDELRRSGDGHCTLQVVRFLQRGARHPTVKPPEGGLKIRGGFR